MSEKTCDEIISGKMEQLHNQLREVLELEASRHDMEPEETYLCPICEQHYDADDDYHLPRQCFEEDYLAVSIRKVVRIELSWGGPQDYVKLEYDQDGYLIDGSYHYLDWFDGASRPMSKEDLNLWEELYPEYIWE